MKNDEIVVTIHQKDDFYDKFNSLKLSEELGHYLYNQSLKYRPKNNLTIKMKCSFSITSEEQQQVIKMIQTYFTHRISEVNNYYKFNSLKKVILFTLGLIFILISNLWKVKNDFLFSEIFLIIGWVAIWEVVENILLIETKKKYQYKYLQKLQKSKIVFEM